MMTLFSPKLSKYHTVSMEALAGFLGILAKNLQGYGICFVNI